MADIATLGFRADTRPLIAARDAMRNLATEGKNAKRASDELGRAIDDTGRRGRTAAAQIGRLRDESGRLATTGGHASRALDGVSAASARASASAKGLAAAFARVSGAAAGFISAIGAGAMFGLANEYDRLINQLRVLGMSQEQATATLRALNDMASETRGSLSGTVQLYQRVSMAARDLGASQSEVMEFTRAVNLAMAQTGQGGAAAEGALIQLSQALGGTVIQAEEFNSLMDGAYPLLKAAAAGIEETGGSVGKLRKMVLEGSITTREFFEAILSQSGKLQSQVEDTNLTVSQSFTQLRNEMIEASGALSNYYGVTLTAAGAISGLADAVSSATKWLTEHEGVLARIPAYAGAAAAVIGGQLVASMVSARIATLSLAGALATLRTALMRIGIGLVIVAVGEAAVQFSKLSTAAGGVGEAFSALWAVVAEVVERIGFGLKASAAQINVWGYTAVAVGAEMAAGLTRNVIGAVNKIIGAFKAAGDAIGVAFQAIPGIVGDAVAGAVNFVVQGTESMINGALSAINSLLQKLPEKVREFIGAADGLGTVDLSGYMMEVSGAAGKAADDIQGVVDAAMNTQYVSAGTVEALDSISSSYAEQTRQAEDAAKKHFESASAELQSIAALGKLMEKANESGKAVEEAADAATNAAEETGKLGDAAAAAGDKLGNAGGRAKAMGKDAEGALGDATLAAQKFSEELAGRLVQAIDGVANAFGDFVARGLRDFGGFVNAVLSSFQQMLSQMIAMAARNRILISMGIDPAGMAIGGIGGGLPLPGAAGGPLGGFLGPVLGSFGAPAAGGIFGGIGGVWSGITAGWQSGGIFGALTGGIGASISGITSGISAGGLAGITGAIGAAIPIIAGVGAVVSIAKKLFGKTLKDTGIEATFTMAEGLAAYTYKFYKGGLFSSDETKRSDLPIEAAAPLERAMTEIGENVLDMAETLGVAGASLEDLSYNFKFSTKGMSEEEIQKRLEEELDKFASAAASAAVEGLDEFLKIGEEAYDGLQRLSSALTAANSSLDMLGKTLFEVSLAGADMASQLADAFGGLDSMTGAIQNYFDKFYTESEKRAWLERSATEALRKVNLALPRTRDEYRAMVQGLDLTTKAGRETFAVLLGLADAMDTLLPAVANLSQALVDAANAVITNSDLQIEYAKSMASELRSAAKDWYTASKAIRDQIRDMYQSADSGASEADKLKASAAAYRSAVERAKAGDVEAAKAVTGLAQTYVENLRSTAGSREEFARREAMIRSELGLVAGIAELNGASSDVQAQLYENMVTVLEDLKAFLSLQGLTEEDLSGFGEDVQALFADFDGTVASFEAQLESLTAAIEQSKGLTYETLMNQLNLNVDVISKSGLPADIKQLLMAANDGIVASVDFMVRSDLPPDLKWLALTQQSEHAKTIDLLAGKRLPPDIMRLAVSDISKMLKTIDLVIGKAIPADIVELILSDFSTLTKTIDLLLGNDLPPDLKRLIMSDTSKLTKTIDMIIGKGLSPDLLKIAREDASRLAKTIDMLQGRGLPADILKLATSDVSRLLKTIDLATGKTIPDDIKRIALASSSELARTVNVILSKSSDPTAIRLGLSNIGKMTVTVNAVLEDNPGPAIRRIVLDQAGQYAAMIALVFESDMSDAARRVVLRQQGGYISTISAVLDAHMPNDVKRVLLNASMTAAKSVTILAAFGRELTPAQRRALMLDSDRVTRTINAILSGAPLTADQRLWLSAASARVTRTITGIVNTGNMTPEQRALLSAISGSARGTITLGGTFRFDPSNAFVSWYGEATKTQITNPMNSLRSSIDTLRSTIQAEMEAAERERQRQARITEAQNKLSQAYSRQQSKVSSTQKAIDDIWALADKYGVNLGDGEGGQAFFKIDESGRFRADFDSLSGGNTEGFKREFYGRGYGGTTFSDDPRTGRWRDERSLAGKTYGQMDELNALARQVEQARAAVRAAGGVPMFASGGFHAGGLRIVGEDGPEIEATGPARIWNAQDTRAMMGGDVAAEVRALREEVRRLREENTSGQVQIAKHAKKTADIARKWDVDGQPEVRTAGAAP